MLTVPTTNYYAGRLRPPRVIVLHTAQVPCRPGRAYSVMLYLANPSVRASAHYCTDPDATVAGVAEADTAWATPSANADGLQVEQAGYAEFGSGGRIPGRNGDRDGYQAARDAYGEGAPWPSWDDPEPARMIAEQTVPLVAELCNRWSIPARLLDVVELADPSARGIIDHVRASRAFGGDHWDCGHHYPLDDVVAAVGRHRAGLPAIPPEDPDTMTRLIRDADTGQLYWWDGHQRAPVGVNAGETWEELEARLKGLIAMHPSCSYWPAGSTGAGTDPALFLDVPHHDIGAIPVA